MISFVYPLGAVVYMPATIIYFSVLICSFAEIYQVTVSLSWFLIAIVMITLMTIALPPLPGADIVCYSVLFSSLGIPSKAIVLATVLSVVTDHFDTAANVTLLMFQMTCDAQRLGNLNREILLSHNNL